MKTFIVGGAVRDFLLNQQPKDIDYVLVGATPADMDQLIKKGYTQVGKDFPVFINPNNKCEYALARTERKVGKGYLGFQCNTTNVSLEDDLKRRDLTINAIAFDEKTKAYIDPYNGRKDLESKVLRHVSNSFKEDPVRVLRCARFSARFTDFSIAPETLRLMKDMVDSGEVDNLTPNRVLIEVEKACTEKKVSNFINVLRDVGAWERVFNHLSPLTKVGIERINYACTENIAKNAYMNFWGALCLNENVDTIEAIKKHFKLNTQVLKFTKHTNQIQKDIKNFDKLSSKEIVVLFDKQNFRNAGAEEYVNYIVSFFLSVRFITFEIGELFEKFYSIYESIDIEPYIHEANKNGSVVDGIWIKNKLQELRINELRKYTQS